MTTSAPHTPNRMSVSAYGWRIVWHGGEYAEIFAIGYSTPVDALNLWDHTNDCPLKAYTRGDLRTMLREWKAENQDVLNDYIASVAY